MFACLSRVCFGKTITFIQKADKTFAISYRRLWAIRLDLLSERDSVLVHVVPAPGKIYVTPLRLRLGGRRVLSAHLNVETAPSQRKRLEI